MAGQSSSIAAGRGRRRRLGRWGGGARVVLYEQPGFAGRRIAVDSEFLPNLSSTGFNDRASSLRVERGYWMFCTDAGFQGTCRTFGRATIRSCRRAQQLDLVGPPHPPGLSVQSSPTWSGYAPR
jgi:hypothetical protein